MANLAFAPLAVLLLACAPDPLTPAGARVTLAPAPAAGCALVAALRGSAGYNGRSGETNAASVETYLRNQTAERSGDTLVITSRKLGAGGDGDTLSQPRGAAVSGGCPNCVSMTANAYRCASPRATVAATASPVEPRAPAGGAPVPRATAPSAEADPPFSDKAAAAALAAAAESARACGDKGDAGRELRVKVTFATTGDVVYSEAVGALADRAAGDCVARKFRNARVPPFSGEARTLGATVRLGE